MRNPICDIKDPALFAQALEGLSREELVGIKKGIDAILVEIKVQIDSREWLGPGTEIPPSLSNARLANVQKMQHVDRALHKLNKEEKNSKSYWLVYRDIGWVASTSPPGAWLLKDIKDDPDCLPSESVRISEEEYRLCGASNIKYMEP